MVRHIVCVRGYIAAAGAVLGEGKAEKDLPQALIHFEIALRNEKGLRAEASSRTSGAFLSALSFERAGEILKSALKEQSMLSDDFSCVKSRLLWR